MKVPKTFQLAAVTWTVREVDGLDEMGRCDPATATILLRKSLPPQVKLQTFCHELEHALRFASGHLEAHDEKEVDAIGNLLHQFLTTYR